MTMNLRAGGLHFFGDHAQLLPVIVTLVVTLVVMQTQGLVLEEDHRDMSYWDYPEENQDPGRRGG